jgi:hypothetical protein
MKNHIRKVDDMTISHQVACWSVKDIANYYNVTTSNVYAGWRKDSDFPEPHMWVSAPKDTHWGRTRSYPVYAMWKVQLWYHEWNANRAVRKSEAMKAAWETRRRNRAQSPLLRDHANVESAALSAGLETMTWALDRIGASSYVSGDWRVTKVTTR